MLFWRRLGNCSGFELKCCLDLESTRLNLESTPQCLELTRHFWRRLVLRNPEIFLSSLLTRVDSDILGVDSALRARTPDLLSVDLCRLGVDSNCLGVDSALRDENTVFCLWGCAASESTRTLRESTRLLVSEIGSLTFCLVFLWESTLASLGIDLPTIGVDSSSSGVDSALRVQNSFSVFLSVLSRSRLVECRS